MMPWTFGLMGLVVSLALAHAASASVTLTFHGTAHIFADASDIASPIAEGTPLTVAMTYDDMQIIMLCRLTQEALAIPSKKPAFERLMNC